MDVFFFFFFFLGPCFLPLLLSVPLSLCVCACECASREKIFIPYSTNEYETDIRRRVFSSVHYEFNDDGLIQTWRAFSVVQYPDPGAGIKKEVLPGW